MPQLHNFSSLARWSGAVKFIIAVARGKEGDSASTTRTNPRFVSPCSSARSSPPNRRCQPVCAHPYHPHEEPAKEGGGREEEAAEVSNSSSSALGASFGNGSG